MKYMKKSKRVTAVTLLVLFLMLTASAFCSCGTSFDDTVYAVVSENNLSGDGFYYSLYENNTAVITGWKPVDCKLVIPDKVDGYTVTRIGKDAFRDLEAIKYVSVSSGIRVIEANAFAGCKELLYAELGGGVVKIGDSAFSECSALREVYGGEAVTDIGNSAFMFCSSLAKFTFGPSIKSIGNDAFYYCSALSEADLSSGKKSGSGTVTLGNGVFAYCSGLTYVNLGGASSVPCEAFVKCTSLVRINIGDGIASIGEQGFRGCENLETIYIGKNLTEISDAAFYDCASLANIRYAKGGSAFGKIKIAEGNECFSGAEVTYKSAPLSD